MKLGYILWIPFIAIFGLTFLPMINAPKLWFGLPSLFVWLVGWAIMITVLLFIYHSYSEKGEEQ